MAFGSLVIGIISILKGIVSFLVSKFSLDDNDSGCIKKFVSCTVLAACFCCDSCLKFISKNAYIETAIWGDHYLKVRGMLFVRLIFLCVRMFAKSDAVACIGFVLSRLLV
jgi:hypothetical protein